MYSNAQILTAVLNKWMQPVVQQFASSKMASLPLIGAINNKVRSTGWVSPQWDITAELSPIIEPITNNIMQPLLGSYISRIPDSAIPQMAHGIVDAAIERGELELFEGKVIFEEPDLQELKKLLDYNLPLKKDDIYEVKMQPDPTTTEV